MNMYMLLAAAGLVVSFVLLVKGADFFVDGCVSIAKLLRVPNLIIGLTIVAMGTSAPEAAVSISGAITDPSNAGITVGNIFGSNILNILVILGLSAVIVPITVDRSLLKKGFPISDGICDSRAAAVLAVRDEGYKNCRIACTGTVHLLYGVDGTGCTEKPQEQPECTDR